MDIKKSVIENFTLEDLDKIDVYKSFLNEARINVKDICRTYSFQMFEDVIIIWKDSYNQERLTHDGFWEARYLHENYNVKIDVEYIFELYKNDYNRIGNAPETARHFRSFAKNAREAAELLGFL